MRLELSTLAGYMCKMVTIKNDKYFLHGKYSIYFYLRINDPN